MKAITPIIAIITIILIVVSLAGAAWSFFSGYWGGLTAKNIEILDTFKNRVTIKNIGTGPISTDEITILVNENPATIINPQTIEPGNITTLKFVPSETGFVGVRVIGVGRSFFYTIEIETPTSAGWTKGNLWDYDNGVQDVGQYMGFTWNEGCSGFGATPTSCLWDQNVIISDGHSLAGGWKVTEVTNAAYNGKFVITDQKTYDQVRSNLGNPPQNSFSSRGKTSYYFQHGSGYVIDGDEDNDGYLGCDWEHWSATIKENLGLHFRDLIFSIK